MAKTGSWKSASETAMPPRAANSHSTSVGSRTNPGAPSSFGRRSGAFFASQALHWAAKATASAQVTLTFGNRPSGDGAGQDWPKLAACSAVTSYLPR